MPYTAGEHANDIDRDALRARIPGWGVDLDRNDRPSAKKERTDLVSGAHWDVPEQQEETVPRERSIEHLRLPPVFGTSVPLKGLSGVVRRVAYARYSEARAAHWLLLVLGDRIDAIESHLVSLASRHPDDLITESGVLSEFSRHGLRSRFGRGRADLGHQWMDPILVAGPWVLAIWLVVRGVRRVGRR